MLKIKQFLPVLAIVAGTSAALAFNQPADQSINWFEVEDDGTIASTPFSPGAECEPDSDLGEYCAVAFDGTTPPVTHIDDTELEGGSEPVEGVLYKEPD